MTRARRPHALARRGARLLRSLRLGVRAAGRGVVEFYNSDNLTYSASIAYYSLLSLFPFLLLVSSIMRSLEVGPTAEVLRDVVREALPAHLAPLVRMVQAFNAPAGLSVFGTLVMLWASMGVFGAVTSAVNHAWGVEQSPGFFRHKLVAFLMLMAAGVLAVVALALVTAVQVVDAQWFGDVLVRFPALATLGGLAYRNLATLLFIVVVGLVYYFVPVAKVRLRDVWFGAILAGLLWRLALAAYSQYMSDVSRYSVEGSIASVLVFLLWVYMSAAILLYGVEVTAAYARLRKHLSPDAPAAPVRDA
ncbi:MAG TPA: YihY/virulence factor BrkB family protein [Vicinamibacterales bacterium]|nr:YihY/virulence factor BrkB family protein [Vicinamibacterales bacterium]